MKGLHIRITRSGSFSVFDGNRKLAGGLLSEADAREEIEREEQKRAGTYRLDPLVLRDFAAEFKALP